MGVGLVKVYKAFIRLASGAFSVPLLMFMSEAFSVLFFYFSEKSEVAQSCPTLYDPIDCSLPGSSVYGIFQAIVLEWIAISFSRGSSQPRAQTQVS